MSDDHAHSSVVSSLPSENSADGLTRALLLIAEIRDLEERLASLQEKLADTVLLPRSAEIERAE